MYHVSYSDYNEIGGTFLIELDTQKMDRSVNFGNILHWVSTFHFHIVGRVWNRTVFFSLCNWIDLYLGYADQKGVILLPIQLNLPVCLLLLRFKRLGVFQFFSGTGRGDSLPFSSPQGYSHVMKNNTQILVLDLHVLFTSYIQILNYNIWISSLTK